MPVPALRSRHNVIPKQYKFVINWGNSTPVSHSNAKIFNDPYTVSLAVDKLKTFEAFTDDGVRCPDVLTSLGTDVRDGIYLARTKVTGSGGDGIVVVRPKDEVPPAPLYVKYIPKREEYRVHVAFGKVIFAQQKRRVIEREQTKDEKLIRNHANGWVFCPVDVESLTEDMKDVALAACASLGLDFGALDIIVGRDDGLAYCLECNSAPGLSSPGLIEAYSKAFTEEMNRGSDGS